MNLGGDEFFCLPLTWGMLLWPEVCCYQIVDSFPSHPLIIIITFRLAISQKRPQSYEFIHIYILYKKWNCFPFVADYLLEDLQNSVSRPGSSLGNHATNTYRETSRSVNTLDSGLRSNSLNRIGNLSSSKPLTEYSSDDTYNYTVSNNN